MRHSVSAALILLFAGAAAAAGEPVTGAPATIPAPDGTKLAATYYAGEKPGPGILLLHQCNKDRSSWNGLAERLAREGFHVLTVDYRGYGESGGKRHLDLSDQDRVEVVNEVWPGDVDAAYAYLKSRPGVQGVMGAGGASCGVNQSIQLSRRHPEVKSLVLLSGNTDSSGRQHLKGKSSPPLMLAAADDDDGAVELIAWIDAASDNPANRFVEYKTGGHGTEMFQPHPELPAEIVAWYEATLSGKGKPASTDNRARRDSPRLRLMLMADDPGGFARISETLNAERAKDPKSPILEAAFVNFLGYTALQQGDAKDSVAIMRVNVDGHPASANAWDSLGDAYLADGQRDQAREASEKALELLDSDKSVPDETRKEIRESAQGKLDQLKAKPTSK
jgi:dienelactone hydrolase